MTDLGKRALSLLLALAMCIGCLSGLTFTASAAVVEYETGNTANFSNVIKNWGVRGTDATFLSPNAEAFYANNGTSYSDLSAWHGISDPEEVPDSDLYLVLQELMTDNHSTITSYGDTRELYCYTDSQGNDTSAISSFYSGKAIGPAWDSGATWNREHTWPDSKGLEGSDEDDIMMLRPTSSSENSSRGNKAYGESSGYYDPNAVSGGAYNLHGDVARTMLYVYVRWGNTAYMWGSSGVMESMDVLLKWMEEDPVDTWEMGRNDSVESITGTRNVFVDYPELAFLLFGQEIPAGMTTPSGEASGGEYTITATVNHAAWGSASVSGSSITAFPAEGYQVAGYTLVSGEATVSRNGNVFTVSASSDCTICINFEARQALSVTFLENEAQVAVQTVYSGDSITLPEHTGTVPQGYTFLGWVTEALSQTSEEPETIYAALSSYTPAASGNLYALYSRIDTEAEGESSVFALYSGTIVAGDYLVVYDGGAMKASVASGRLDYSDVTFTDGSVSNPAEDLIWYIAPTGDGYYTIYSESAAAYAASTGAKNKAALNTAVDDKAKWTVTGTEDYEFVNLQNTTNGVNCNLRRNGTYGFACYATSTGGALSLYKRASGVVYYSTSAEACLHSNTSDVAAVEPTCTESGYTAGVYCNDCASYIEGHEPAAPLGHSYEAVVTAPTVTEQGYTTYTCAVCDDSYVSDYTDPTGELVTVSFAVPAGVEAVADMECGSSGIILPEAGVPAGEYAYTFAGWAEATVEDTETAPTLWEAGSTYTTDEAVTLYAVYTYTLGASDRVEWVHVTDASALTAGTQLVLASNAKGFVAGNITSKYLSSVSATFSDDLSTLTALPVDAVVLTLGGSEGAWTLTNADGALLGATSVKNLAWGSGTTTWSITIADGNATIQNGTSTYGRFLYNVNSPRFTTYTSNTNVSMLLPQLYMLQGSFGTTYYTTLTEVADATLAGASLTAEGNIGVNFFVELSSSVAADENAKLLFTMGNASRIVPVSEAVVVDGLYRFTYEVAAKEMADDIVAQVYNSDGTVGEPMSYSVMDYYEAVKTNFDPEADAALYALMESMLNYGAYSQLHFGYNTGALANSGLDEELKVLPETVDASAYKRVITGSEDGIAFCGASLLLESETTIRLFFKLTGDKTIDEYEFIVDGEAVTPVERGGMYYVEKTNIAAKDLDEMYSFTVGGLTVSYSALSYVYRVLAEADSYGADLIDLVKALFVYSEKANAYFA